MPFSPDQVEDGTGLTSAVVYEQNADAAAWLVARGFTAFASLDDAGQMAKLLLATEAAEEVIGPYLRAFGVTQGQGLHFPAFGAYGSNGELFMEDSRPPKLLEAIRMIAERMAEGTWMVLAASGVGAIKSESTRRGSIVYRDAINPASVQSSHPDIWGKLRTLFPTQW